MPRTIKFRIFDQQKSLLGIFDWNKMPQMLFPENWILLQFTGMFDKNGIDIYEGDILKVRGWRGSTGIVEVKWQESLSSDDAGVNMVGFRSFDEYGEPEIIGNIFENPELLK